MIACYRSHYKCILEKIQDEITKKKARLLAEFVFWSHTVELSALCGVTYVSNRENYRKSMFPILILLQWIVFELFGFFLFCCSSSRKNFHHIHDLLAVPHVSHNKTVQFNKTHRPANARRTNVHQMEEATVRIIYPKHNRFINILFQTSFLLSWYGIQLVCAEWVLYRLFEYGISLYNYAGFSQRTLHYWQGIKQVKKWLGFGFL